MNRLILLAISDTHLGEDDSLLSYPTARRELWKVLRENFGRYDRTNPNDTEPFEVDELILLGDIPDRTLSSTSLILSNVDALTETLGSAAIIRKCVYLPGNHDHTTWSEYWKRRHGEKWGVTPPEGELVVQDGERVDISPQALAAAQAQDPDARGPADDYLEILFGYPDGASWRRIEDPGDGQKPFFEFRLANPLYATVVKGRTYAFAHGTHFRGHWDVGMKQFTKWVCYSLGLYRLLGGLKVNPRCDVRKATDLVNLEQRIHRFVDTLWPDCGNDPSDLAEKFYYLVRCVTYAWNRQRPAPHQSTLHSWTQLPHVNPNVVRHLTPEGQQPDESLILWHEHFQKFMQDYLEQHRVPTEHMTFVYGDTHEGGWGEVGTNRADPLRIYNTGGWVTDGRRHHPPCHVFAVKEDGEECLLDVSFRHVKVGRDKMVAVASEAAAARHPWWLQVLRPGIHGAAVVWRALHRKPQADIAGW